jgi:hypothetical protein
MRAGSGRELRKRGRTRNRETGRSRDEPERRPVLPRPDLLFQFGFRAFADFRAFAVPCRKAVDLSPHPSLDGGADLTRPRPAAEVGREEALGEGGADGILDAGGGGARGGAGAADAEPIEHHGGGEDRRDRVGDAPPRDVRRGAMDRLEEGMPVADIRGRRHAQAADQPGSEIGEDISELRRSDSCLTPEDLPAVAAVSRGVFPSKGW